MNYTCLDSWAVLAWMNEETFAADAVTEAYRSGRPVMSWMNAAEVFYHVERRSGPAAAASAINTMRTSTDLELPTERRILEAARLKTSYPIALADCFAISCAADNDAVLYTGDPEIIEIADLPCEVRDLRA